MPEAEGDNQLEGLCHLPVAAATTAPLAGNNAPCNASRAPSATAGMAAVRVEAACTSFESHQHEDVIHPDRVSLCETPPECLESALSEPQIEPFLESGASIDHHCGHLRKPLPPTLVLLLLDLLLRPLMARGTCSRHSS